MARPRPNPKLGIEPRDRARVSDREKYSVGDLLARAMLARDAVRWSDFVKRLKTTTQCPAGAIETLVSFIDRAAPFLAADGLIDPAAIEAVLEECGGKSHAKAPYNLSTDARKPTERLRLVRNARYVRKLSRNASINGGQGDIDAVLKQEVPLPADRPFLRKVLESSELGANGNFRGTVFRERIEALGFVDIGREHTELGYILAQELGVRVADATAAEQGNAVAAVAVNAGASRSLAPPAEPPSAAPAPTVASDPPKKTPALALVRTPPEEPAVEETTPVDTGHWKGMDRFKVDHAFVETLFGGPLPSRLSDAIGAVYFSYPQPSRTTESKNNGGFHVTNVGWRKYVWVADADQVASLRKRGLRPSMNTAQARKLIAEIGFAPAPAPVLAPEPPSAPPPPKPTVEASQPAPAPEPPAATPVDIDRLVNERLEAELEKRLPALVEARVADELTKRLPDAAEREFNRRVDEALEVARVRRDETHRALSDAETAVQKAREAAEQAQGEYDALKRLKGARKSV